MQVTATKVDQFYIYYVRLCSPPNCHFFDSVRVSIVILRQKRVNT